MNRYVFIAPVLAATAFATPAQATTNCAEFELIGSGGRANYQPFDPEPTAETFELRVRRLADGVSAVRFLLVDQSPQPAGPKFGAQGPLFYDIIWLQDNTRKVLVVGNQQPQPLQNVELSLPGRSGVDIARFRILIPAGQPASAQQHREDLLVRYQCLGGNGAVLGGIQEQPAPIPLSVTVPKYAAAYIGSVGQTRGAISFGNIDPNSADLSKSINITALSTLPYELSFESENGGRLRKSRNDPDGIVYTMRYGNVAVRDGDHLVCPTTPAPMGAIEQFQVTLDRESVARQIAGNYSDTVELTFTPKDVVSSSGCAIQR